MRKIVWHNATKDDLLDIVSYLKRSFGKAVAKKGLSEIKETVNLLATFPFLGTKDDSMTYYDYAIYTLHSRYNRILYTVREKDVLILIIWNNRRDISKIAEILKDRDN